MEETEFPETSASKIQTQENCPEESIQQKHICFPKFMVSFSFPWSRARNGSRPPRYRDVNITLDYTHHTSSRRVISPTQRPLLNHTQHSQETDTHAPGGIRSHNTKKREGANSRLRPHCHWDRPRFSY